MIYHLIIIDDLYTTLVHPIPELASIWVNDVYCMIPTGEYEPVVLERARFLWHYSWAILFKIVDIDSTQLLVRAKIIHVIQIVISLLSMYYFSKVVIRNVFFKIDRVILKYLSLWSVFIWLTIFATKSVDYHQVWMMWYSVNYQITLPLFWYMLALTFVLVLEEISVWKKIFFSIQIMLLSRIILQIHSMEFLYYLMYMALFGLIYIDKIYIFFKKYFYLFVPILLSIVYFMKHYQPDHSPIFEYLSLDKMPELYQKIMQKGGVLLSGYNRASFSINELMYFIGIVGVLFSMYLLFQYRNSNQKAINIRMILVIWITSLFVLIPLYQFSSGLFAVITRTMVVNRLYYSASLFMVLPIVIYYVIRNFKYSFRAMNLILILSLVVVYHFSKYSNTVGHNYYKNIQSIQNSFYERKVGFNLTQVEIDKIGKIIEKYEDTTTPSTIKFYARADIAFVIKYVYHKNVYWEGRHANPEYKKIYEKNKYNKDSKQILFKIPKSFPKYDPFT